MALRAKIIVTGKVQGVFYRDSTVKKATQLGLSGAAWNLKSGQVEILCEGKEEQIKELEKWCWKGAEGAKEVGIDNDLSRQRKVEGVEVEWVGEGSGEFGGSFRNGGRK